MSGQTSSTIPKNPIARPIHCRACIGWPPGNIASTLTIQNGVVPMSTAVRPLDRYCSPQTTPPLPSMSMKKPRIASRPQSSRPGNGCPCSFSQVPRMTPLAM